jgi:hypothetical protein
LRAADDVHKLGFRSDDLLDALRGGALPVRSCDQKITAAIPVVREPT